ncbi:MAG: hypothetical protein KJN90_06650 [Gammaproteobacteria bacterium]|nr:hypothetical protein [Gammaproteobacteria bacterium]
MSWRSKGSWQVSIDTTSLLASDLQILGLCFLQLNDKANAKVYLDKQLHLLREADEWLYLPSGFNARAAYYWEIGEYVLAQKDLLEALEISRRTGARLGEWETCINLAQLHFQQGNIAKSKKYLKEMQRVPGMELYRFRDQQLLMLQNALYGNNRAECAELSVMSASGEAALEG